MRFLITAGGTREYIDPVRFISNASSGKMGYALARAAIRSGHKVTLITAPVNLKSPAKAKIVHVESSQEMFEAVKKYFDRVDCLIMAAAVSDYRPKRIATTKIKKSQQTLTIELKPTVDILKWAGGQKKVKGKKGGQRIVVGFALEDKRLKEGAGKKMKDKNLDMVIANRPTAIGADNSVVEVKTAGGEWMHLGCAAKATIARQIIRLIEGVQSAG